MHGRIEGMRYKAWTGIAAGVVLIGAMALWSNDNAKTKPAPAPQPGPRQDTATFGAGCFWCVEAVLQQVPGVVAVTSGYMGGHVERPSYEDVCTGKTGHAEVVQVVFDPQKLPYAALLGWFWKLHDPTQVGGQGGDEGPQYRSVIFFHSEAQRVAAEASKAAVAKDLPKPVATEIVPAGAFWPAETYHQDYYRQNRNRNPYCPAVITPKLRKLGLGE